MTVLVIRPWSSAPAVNVGVYPTSEAPLRRCLFNLFAILSLLLSFASVWLWIRSASVDDKFEWLRHHTARYALFSGGRVMIQINHGPHRAAESGFEHQARARTGEWFAQSWRYGGFWVENG